MKLLLLLSLAGTLMRHEPKPKITKWELAQFRYLILKCIDVKNTNSWRSAQIVTSSYFDVEHVKKEVVEQNNDKVVLYYVTDKNKIRKLADGITKNGSFLLKDAHSGESYEEKIIEQNLQFLILSSEPGSLNIFFNPKNPPDSLTVSQINKYMVQSGKLFGRAMPFCK